MQPAFVKTQDVNITADIGWVYCFRPLNHCACASDKAVGSPKTRKSKSPEMLIHLPSGSADNLRRRIYSYEKAISRGTDLAQNKADRFAPGTPAFPLSKNHRGGRVVRSSRHDGPQWFFSQRDKVFDRLIESILRGRSLIRYFPQIETIVDPVRSARDSDEGLTVRTDFTSCISPETVVRGPHATVGGNDDGVGHYLSHDKGAMREYLGRCIGGTETGDSQYRKPQVAGTIPGWKIHSIETDEHGNGVLDISTSDTDISEDAVHRFHLMGSVCGYGLRGAYGQDQWELLRPPSW